MALEIHIREYTTTPGARYVKDGPYSGEDFRNKHLEPLFKDETNKEEITVHLDGTEGFATSFLEEAFGGLARIFGVDRCKKRLRFVSNEDGLLVEEIEQYIQEAFGRE